MQKEQRASNPRKDGLVTKEKDRSEEWTSVIDLTLVKTDPDKLHPLIYHTLKRTLKEWEEFMNQRPGLIRLHTISNLKPNNSLLFRRSCEAFDAGKTCSCNSKTICGISKTLVQTLAY